MQGVVGAVAYMAQGAPAGMPAWGPDVSDICSRPIQGGLFGAALRQGVRETFLSAGFQTYCQRHRIIKAV